MSVTTIKTTFNQKPLVTKDVIEGTAQLTSQGVLEVTDLVSAMHKEIVIRPFTGIAPQLVEEIYENTTGKIYDIIKYIMQFSGETTTHSLRLVNSQLPSHISSRALSNNVNVLVSVLNGVMGDHLVTQDNPLAVPMLVYDAKSKLHDVQNLSGNIVICVHGLCMNHQCWLPNNKKGLGYKIHKEIPDSTVLYLDYNTGRRISENGEEFSELLTKIVADNPSINTISIVGHSMGGLITRSAMFYAEQAQADWLKKLKNYIAVCSPHQGAVLERLGYVFQHTVSKIPVAGNLARLGNLRSAGIIDLRHASLRHEDWQELDRMGSSTDTRHSTPLPITINTYLIGASIDSDSQEIHDKVGDGLVSLASALGEHQEEKYNLNVPHVQKAVFYNVDHMKILQSDNMHQQVLTWLS